MSVELIPFKYGMLGIFPGRYRVKSRWYGDVAAAHHVKVRKELKRLAKIGTEAAEAQMASHMGGVPKDGDHRFKVRHGEGKRLDQFIWLETTVAVSGGRGFRKRHKNAVARAKGAVRAYEFGFTPKGSTRKAWGGVGPLHAAIDAIHAAGRR